MLAGCFWRHGELHVAVVQQELVKPELRIAGVFGFHIRFVNLLLHGEVVTTGSADYVRNLASTPGRHDPGHALIYVGVSGEHSIGPNPRLLAGIIDVIAKSLGRRFVDAKRHGWMVDGKQDGSDLSALTFELEAH